MHASQDRFRRVFDACYAPLYAYARRRTVAADVDDVVAETLLVAWRRLDDVPEGLELAWLYGTARRVLANQRRGDARRVRLVDRLKAEPSPRAPDAIVDDELDAALRGLGARDREILRLAAWEQLTAAELGVALGCSANAAALRLSRARRRLRDELTRTRQRRTQAGWKVTDA